MKQLSITKTIVAASLLLLTVSCGTKKKTVQTTKPLTEAEVQQGTFLRKVNSNAITNKYITSKVKFRIRVGAQDMTLTGNLRMLKDDVIQLQLMAFGFVEAGRLEFTPDRVLIVDRINKQYIKASYNMLDFLRNTGLNFYSLQSLFWNELFMPGETDVKDETLQAYKSQTAVGDDEILITYSRDKMSYKWLADKNSALIKMANIEYKDKIHGQTQLNWDYSKFDKVDKKQFPKKHTVTFTSPESKEVKIDVTLNYIEHKTEWETRTELSSQYTQVALSEILRKFMAL